MGYIYRRPNGIFEIRYPIPGNVRCYFPKGDGGTFKSHVIVSLGTRDQTEANRSAVSKFEQIEQKFAVLRDGAQTSGFVSFCQSVFEEVMEEGSRRNLEHSVYKPEIKIGDRTFKNSKSSNKSESYRAHELHAVLEALGSRDPEQLEAVAGWVVDEFLNKAGGFKALVPSDTPLRTILLTEASAVLRDAYTQLAADFHGQSYKPALKAASLKTSAKAEIAPGDTMPPSPEGSLSLSKYWHVHVKTRQSSPSPLARRTILRRETAWKELCDLVGADTPIFKVTKADIWRYSDALKATPAHAGSITALQQLSFTERNEAMRRHPGKYANLDQNTIADRLRQISAVFQFAVKRGHVTQNPALGISESKKTTEKARSAYSDAELQRIFSSAPFDRAPPQEMQTDEYWVPLLELFLGARASELYVRTQDVILDHQVPHLRLVEYDERTLKNAASARALPIHPVLVDLGFLQYCRRAKVRGGELFPTWKFRENQNPSEGPGRRRFNRHLKKLMPDRGGFPADSHTFRHNFESALSGASGVSERIMRRLTGRSIGGSAASYVHDLRMLPELEDAISKVQYRGLSLKHLKPA
jgi:integrase